MPGKQGSAPFAFVGHSRFKTTESVEALSNWESRFSQEVNHFL